MKLKTWFITLIMAFVVQFSFSQEKSISGTVTSAADGLPLPGVNIIVQGTTRGAQTDFDGNYTIKASQGETLVFSFLGMSNKTAPVGASNTVNVSLAEDAESLAEIVVVGFSTKSREELTSAVANVTSEDLQKIAPSVSIDNMLQGVASGVQVTAQNGKPGQTAFIRIRGIGSINAGNEPLYIVDGAPVSEADINGINPTDVESVSVLKDAASTSIYGARGGNGVVLITTKRGKKGQDATFKLSSRLGWARKTQDNFTMMNAAQKLQYERELGVGVGSSIASQAEYDRLVGLGHDWKDDLLRDGFVQSTSLSIRGGEEKSSYFFSVGYDEDSGIIRDIDGYNRVSSRLNVDFDAKEWVKTGASLSFSGIETGDPRDRNNVQNPFRAMYDYNPYETFYLLDANGNVVLDANGNQVLNPTSAGYPVSSELRENRNARMNNRFLGNVFFDFKLSNNLNFLTKASGIYDQYRRENFLEPGSTLDLIVNGGVPTGSKTDNGSFDFTYNWLNKMTYTNTFNEVHNVEATVLSEYIRNNFRSYSANGDGFLVGGPSVLDAAATPIAVGSARSEYTIFSLAGNVDYNYDGRYIVTATVRRDGSSRFGKDSKYGTFWSASAAWNISNESFFQDNIFNTLKLRASAGTSGNDQIGRYTSISTYGPTAYNNGGNGIVPANFGDPTLTWEENFNYGVGVEFGILKNRIRGLVDYYSRTTDKLLLNQVLPNTTGAYGVVGNLGEMVNTGWEFELIGDIVRTDDLKWTISGNVNLYDNEVTRLVTADDAATPGNESDLFTTSNAFSILRVGEEVNTFYIPRYAGVNPANGEALYLDTDGNVTNVAAGNEVALSGKSPFADLDGSIGSTIEYKGWDLSANFYFKKGNYIYNIPESNMLSDGDSANDNQRLDAFNYWRNPGDTNVLPRPSSSGFSADANQTSDRFLQKGDYIRLRSLQLGYNLPSQFTDKLAIKNARVYAAGNNLWTYAPYYKGDPEVGIGSGETQGANVIPGEYSLYSYPTTASLSFGVDIQF